MLVLVLYPGYASMEFMGGWIYTIMHPNIQVVPYVMVVRLLVAGSLLGEVLIFSVEENGSPLTLHHVQTLPGCCGAPVTCTAWSTDCRYAKRTQLCKMAHLQENGT